MNTFLGNHCNNTNEEHILPNKHAGDGGNKHAGGGGINTQGGGNKHAGGGGGGG